MRYLLVGDMHCTRSEIPDCLNLINYIDKCSKEHKVDVVVFMGDQTNNHAIIDSYVMDFWKDTFSLISASQVIVIVGNHDQANSKDEFSPHSMAVFTGKKVVIVDTPMRSVDGHLTFIPYIHNNEEFIKQCNKHSSTTLFCHQSFNGARYENGFPIEDGADAAKLPQKHIYSGHIHNKSKFGKLTYVGSPRWRNVMDSNQDKSLLVVDFVDGVPINEFELPTEHVVPKFYAFKDTEEDPCDISGLPDSAHVTIDIHGSNAYVMRRKTEFPKGYRIRTYVERIVHNAVKESEGVEVALNKYLSNYSPKYGSDKEKLNNLIKERLK